MKLQAHKMELAGTHYEIGTKLGYRMGSIPPLKAMMTAGWDGMGEKEVKQATEMFARWCPGLNEELQGCADALKVPLAKIVFYGLTYLRPNCSQIALPAARTIENVPLLARNYEFSHKAEDFALIRTNAQGKYAHIGTSVLFFGRDEGLNDQGLAVSMSSCGFPVGAEKMMRRPKLVGLQFWAVIRSVLENCKDVDEALDFIKDMPIAYNLNMMLMDKPGRIALIETMDGRMAVKKLEAGGEEYLHATNHIALPEFVHLEPKAMKHSWKRYEWIREKLQGNEKVSKDDLKAMLLAKYPDGLCCHFFEDFFGTTKSIVMNPVHGTIDLCWGGELKNGWHTYDVSKPLAESSSDITIDFEKFDMAEAEFVPLS